MHRFDHEAMNTKLDLLICGADHKYALSAAAECFDKVDILETLLSMYREGSDIDMISAPIKIPGERRHIRSSVLTKF